MAIVPWPAGVPQMLVPGLTQSGRQNQYVRKDMETGPPKARPRSTAGPRLMSGRTSIMNRAQLATFEAWFDNTLKGPVNGFTARDPITLQTATCHAVNTYSVTEFDQVNCYVTLEVEVYR